MKYFRERRRKAAKPKSTEAPENSYDDGKVGADTFSDQQVQADFPDQTQEASRDRCKDRLICARRRKDIRLTRKEVACLQVLVQTVLSEHLVLSRELQEANERAGLPADSKSSLTADARRLPSTLERDAARLKAALLEREERLENAAADGAAVRQERDHWRREYALEADKTRAALREKDCALESAVEKDQVINSLRSELVSLENKRSNEVLCLSRSLREREMCIRKLENQVQDNAAQLVMLQVELNEREAMLEMERTARHSAEKNLESLRLDLEATGILLSEVLSDKEELKKQLEDAKEEFEHDLKELKRAADANLAEVKHACEKAVAQKMVEVLEAKGDLKSAQAEIQRLLSDLEKGRAKDAVLYGELAAARSSMENARNAFSQLDAKCAQERVRHEEQIKQREAEFREELESFRSAAASTQTDLENRLRQLQEESAAEKETFEGQLAVIGEKLQEAEEVAQRLPALESNLKDAEKEIGFLKEKATERNADLAARTKEVKHYSDEAGRARQEADSLVLAKEEELKKLKKELELVKEKRDEDAVNFRRAIHEKDLVIREGQDRLQQIETEQEAIRTTLSTVQKNLEDSSKQHKSSLAKAKSAHREVAAQLKSQISKQSEEIQALKESNKTLHEKITEQFRQHSAEVDKLKASAEKAKIALEKKLQAKKASLKESEEKRASLSGKLSEALDSREVILKELELVRDELKRTVDILWEARAETRLALDTMSDTERAMVTIYADATEEKIVLGQAKLKIDELEEKWLDVRKEVDDGKNTYNTLKARFVKYIACHENELKAAGDSVEQNRAEARRYLDELKSSKTELASSEERCRTLESDLDSALRKLENFCANEEALFAQSEQNRQLLTLAESQVESLKSDLSCQSSDLIQMKNELEDRKSAFEIISADLNKERTFSANLGAESQDTFDLIESFSRGRGLLSNPDAELLEGADLFRKIQILESRLGKNFEQLPSIKEQHDALKQQLSLRTLELDDLKSMLVVKDESTKKLKSELEELHEKMSDQERTIAELSDFLEEILNQASAAFHAQESLKVQLEEGNHFLLEANSSIARLTSHLQFEQSRAAELESQLSLERASYQQELEEKSSSIQDLSQSLSRLESELYSKEDLSQQSEETLSLQERLTERDREVNRLLNLLEHAHQECECKAHHEAADGDKEAHSDGLKSALAERDADVAKLRSVIVELQRELSMSKSTSDDEIASYRFHVEELLNEILALRQQLEEQESKASQQAKLDLHLTAEQTRLTGPEGPRLSPRRRPGAPGGGGAPLKRALSEGNGEWEASAEARAEAPTTCDTDA